MFPRLLQSNREKPSKKVFGHMVVDRFGQSRCGLCAGCREKKEAGGADNSRQGCSGAGTRGIGVPTPFSRFALK